MKFATLNISLKIVVLTVVIFTIAVSHAATVSVTSADRNIEDIGLPSGTIDFVGLGPFTQSEQTNYSNDSSGNVTMASASIDSNIGISSSVLDITESGDVAQFYYGQGAAELAVSFTIDAPFNFSLTANTSYAPTLHNVAAYVWFTQTAPVNGTPCIMGVDDFPDYVLGPATTNLTGVLVAGSYRFHTFVQAVNLPGSGSAHLDFNLAVSPVPPPSPSIVALLGALSVTWPTPATNVVLESTPSLSPPIVWNIVTNSVQANGGLSSVQVDTTQGTQFFRLRWR